jgi:hypothetical protein
MYYIRQQYLYLGSIPLALLEWVLREVARHQSKEEMGNTIIAVLA